VNGDDFTGFMAADPSNKSRKTTEGPNTEYVKFGNVTSSSAGYKSMPMDMKSAEGRMNVYAAMCAAHEAFVAGRITDPSLIDEDYDQLDPDDVEEVDLKWQLAMITRRVQKFMRRTGR